MLQRWLFPSSLIFLSAIFWTLLLIPVFPHYDTSYINRFTKIVTPVFLTALSLSSLFVVLFILVIKFTGLELWRNMTAKTGSSVALISSLILVAGIDLVMFLFGMPISDLPVSSYLIIYGSIFLCFLGSVNIWVSLWTRHYVVPVVVFTILFLWSAFGGRFIMFSAHVLGVGWSDPWGIPR